MDPEKMGSQFFHGTTSELSEGDEIDPSRSGSVFPHMSEEGYAYATPHEGDAWEYAEKAWHTTGVGIPRVYEVSPLGGVEDDPTEWPEGQRPDRSPSRGNNPTDVRSRQPFTVVGERPMPEHMGPPEDWR